MPRARLQVKLRGIRFELGEIEAVAIRSELVAAAAAVVRDERLLLYIVPTVPLESFANAAATAVRITLRTLLPLQLQPAQLVPLSALPLTAGGKLLRSALPNPPPIQPLRRHPDSQAAALSLTTRTERVVAVAWEQVLKVRAKSEGEW